MVAVQAKEDVCARSCYGVEFAARADRDAAVAAMKVRVRWSRAAAPRFFYPGRANCRTAFFSPRPHLSRDLRRGASWPAGAWVPYRSGRISWAPRPVQLPQRLGSASPRSGARPGDPRAHASGPSRRRALSSSSRVRGRPHWCSPRPSWLGPQRALSRRVLELTQLQETPRDRRGMKGDRSGARSHEAGSRLMGEKCLGPRTPPRMIVFVGLAWGP